MSINTHPVIATTNIIRYYDPGRPVICRRAFIDEEVTAYGGYAFEVKRKTQFMGEIVTPGMYVRVHKRC